MLDYEKYGNQFRTPKAFRPEGGPANNGFNGYDGDNTQPEGRPRAQPQDERGPQRQRPSAPQQPQPQGGMLTFRQMQQQGQARPPMPAPQQPPQQATVSRIPFNDAVEYTPPSQATLDWVQQQARPQQPMMYDPSRTEPNIHQMPQQETLAFNPNPMGNMAVTKAWTPEIGRQGDALQESLTPGYQQLRPIDGGQAGRDAYAASYRPSAAQNISGSNAGLEQQLRDAWQNHQSPGQFAGQAARANLPDAYQGQSFNDEAQFDDMPAAYQGQQFNDQYQTTDAPSGYRGQQFGGRYQGVGGPQMRETGQFSDPSGRVMGRTEQSVMEALDNPSKYGSAEVQKSFQRFAGDIDDDYNQRDQQLSASAARRGLGGIGDSTVISNDARFQNLQRRSAKTDLADSLLDKQAQTYGQDRAAAISNAMGFGGQQFGQARDAYSTNRDTNQQNFGQDLAARGFESGERGREFNYGMDAARFNDDIGQRGFDNDFRRADFTAGQRDRSFSAGLQKAGFNNQVGQQGYDNAAARTRERNNMSQQKLDNRFRNTGFNNQVGQQGYQNRFDRAGFEQGVNQQQYQNDRSNFDANLGAQQQGFAQKQAALSALLGYGQQGFDNQMRTADMNDRREREQQEMLMKLMGMS